jgi:hypothetical protein
VNRKFDGFHKRCPEGVRVSAGDSDSASLPPLLACGFITFAVGVPVMLWPMPGIVCGANTEGVVLGIKDFCGSCIAGWMAGPNWPGGAICVCGALGDCASAIVQHAKTDADVKRVLRMGGLLSLSPPRVIPHTCWRTSESV